MAATAGCADARAAVVGLAADSGLWVCHAAVHGWHDGLGGPHVLECHLAPSAQGHRPDGVTWGGQEVLGHHWPLAQPVRNLRGHCTGTGPCGPAGWYPRAAMP